MPTHLTYGSVNRSASRIVAINGKGIHEYGQLSFYLVADVMVLIMRMLISTVQPFGVLQI